MARFNPTISTAQTASVTAFSSTADVRTFDYDGYSWTPLQDIINLGYDVFELPSVLPTKNLTMTILRRAMFLNKIIRRRRVQGRDFL
jgi:hypothetical protein